MRLHTSLVVLVAAASSHLVAQSASQPCVLVHFTSKLQCANSAAVATSRQPAALPPESKLYITPMEGNLHGFIAAEIIKQKLPLVVTTDEKEASLVLTGMSIPADNKWFNTIFGGKDKNEGNLQLINVSTKQLVWAGEAGDRSLFFFPQYRRGGLRKIASRLVWRMKKDLAKAPAPVETGVRVPSQTALTNLDILKLKSTGATDETIISEIKSSRSNYQLGVNDLIALKTLGLSDAVLRAMVSRTN